MPMNFSRRTFLSGLGGGMLSSSLPIGAEQRKPNIVIIMADDLGYGDLSCYGNTRIHTPHLDIMAANGVRFTDFHSNGVVCSPTRAGLMTGRYQQRCQVPGVITAKNHRDHGLPLNEITFAELLKKHGYSTGIFGKWHLGYLPKYSPIEQGFDEFRGFVSGNVDYISHIDQTGVSDWWRDQTLVPEEGYSTHLITQHAVDFIERKKNNPFCLYVAHEAPHYPFQTPDDPADRTIGSNFSVHGSRQDKAAAYKVMVEEMDKGIGQIIETLHNNNLENDTFVFFLSDNGGIDKLGNNGTLRGSKGRVWEGGHRVPAIAYWPGSIQIGQVCHETAISLDVFPTITELVGIDPPNDRPIDGKSILPTLLNQQKMTKKPLFWKYNNQKAMRDEKWKMVISKQGNTEQIELFDLTEDLEEQNNLVDLNSKLANHMKLELKKWEQEVETKG